MTFHIISCGYFDSPYYAYQCVFRNTESVLNQTFGRWYHYVVIDGSSPVDQQRILGEFCKDERHIGIMRDKRYGMAQNIWDTITMINADHDDVIVMLDLDDRFLVDTALSALQIEYQDQQCWLTHGSFTKLSGAPTKLNKPISDDCSIRSQPWRLSHCKTFRLGLFKKLNARDMKGADGKFLSVASDIAMMFCLAEMAGFSRIRFVPELIYEYNDTNPLSDEKIHYDEQKRIERYLRKRAPKRLIHGNY